MVETYENMMNMMSMMDMMDISNMFGTEQKEGDLNDGLVE